jgi:hypothetical protein
MNLRDLEYKGERIRVAIKLIREDVRNELGIFL